MQGTQGGQTVFGRTRFVEAAKKVDDSLSHTVLMRSSKVEYAVRVKACLEYFVLKIGRRPVINDIIDHFQEFSILSVEIEHFSHVVDLQEKEEMRSDAWNIK